MLYSYKHRFSGFAAVLETTQASTLAGMEGVISVFRSKVLKLHTTRSWDFMGLKLDSGGEAAPTPTSTPMQLDYGDDVVVGVFDTGIWPESESFREVPGMGPPPPTWTGTCVSGESFDPSTSCNRKLVGARYYIAGFEHEFGPLNTSGGLEFRSPRDRLGHGTHVASTAVGQSVARASFFGLGLGTARGGAPRARLAVYKVCWTAGLSGRCAEADILAAYDDALSDGVSVISASFGASPPLMRFFETSSDIGSFHAAQVGVAVVFSAGNDGPEPSIIGNVAPWAVTVAASSIDRNFPTAVVLGNNVSIMVYINTYFRDCSFDKWRGKPATGTIILCFSTVTSGSSTLAALAVLAANGSGLIFAEPMARLTVDVDFFPIIHVDITQGTQILYYIKSSKSPTVEIHSSITNVGDSPAPIVAYFSSRGPSSVSPDILKAVSVYFLASIVEPEGVRVTVWPRVLVYTHHRSRASFYVTVAPVKRSRGRYGFGEIVWSDGLHSVRSPVIVRVNNVGRHTGGNPRQLSNSSSI
ncbi:hypothetical protein QJS10_CPB15g02106 [Acorus calamus]|uniref:Uncharacterized protein n=1 Tax=Acorus calamus TaxID=4465 RepID=A0AAV9D759_ACOCL|nr:hypothetical protein QJS10_CPB15g02106 [Acorus calamus]